MPEVVLEFINNKKQIIHAFEQVRIKQTELMHAYNSDIAKHAGKVNAMHIARTWEQAAIQLSKTQNEMAARFHFKDIIPGIDRYQRLANAIDWLNAANLVIKVPIAKNAELPLKVYSKESIFKLFYFDVGLLGACSELLPTHIMSENYGGFKGYMAENFVAEELVSTDIHAMQHLYSWQDYKAEIEFLENTNQGIIPIEVKSRSNIRAKSLEKYYKKYRPNQSVILSMNNIAFDREKKIYYCPIYLAALRPWLNVSSLDSV